MRSAHVIPLLLALACSKSDNRQREQTRGEPPQAAALRLHMRNCPSAVPGAKTTVANTPTGVQLTIEADDPEAQREIITRARMEAGLSTQLTQLPPHTGMHSGTGALGRCPVVHANTAITAETTPRGARVNVRVRDRQMVSKIQAITDQRVRAMQQPSS